MLLPRGNREGGWEGAEWNATGVLLQVDSEELEGTPRVCREADAHLKHNAFCGQVIAFVGSLAGRKLLVGIPKLDVGGQHAAVELVELTLQNRWIFATMMRRVI